MPGAPQASRVFTGPAGQRPERLKHRGSFTGSPSQCPEPLKHRGSFTDHPASTQHRLKITGTSARSVLASRVIVGPSASGHRPRGLARPTVRWVTGAPRCLASYELLGLMQRPTVRRDTVARPLSLGGRAQPLLSNWVFCDGPSASGHRCPAGYTPAHCTLGHRRPSRPFTAPVRRVTVARIDSDAGSSSRPQCVGSPLARGFFPGPLCVGSPVPRRVLTARCALGHRCPSGSFPAHCTLGHRCPAGSYAAHSTSGHAAR